MPGHTLSKNPIHVWSEITAIQGKSLLSKLLSQSQSCFNNNISTQNQAIVMETAC